MRNLILRSGRKLKQIFKKICDAGKRSKCTYVVFVLLVTIVEILVAPTPA